MQKNETGSLSCTIYREHLKMDYRFECKLLEEKMRGNPDLKWAEALNNILPEETYKQPMVT